MVRDRRIPGHQFSEVERYGVRVWWKRRSIRVPCRSFTLLWSERRGPSRSLFTNPPPTDVTTWTIVVQTYSSVEKQKKLLSRKQKGKIIYGKHHVRETTRISFTWRRRERGREETSGTESREGTVSRQKGGGTEWCVRDKTHTHQQRCGRTIITSV